MILNTIQELEPYRNEPVLEPGPFGNAETEPNPLFRPFRNLLELLKPNLPEPIFSSVGFFGLFWFPKHNWKKITKMLVTVVMLSKSNLFKLLNEKSIIFCNVQLLTG